MDDAVGHYEHQELSMLATDALRPENYTELLASYLVQNDLCNAKFLWKRIPAEMKTSEELAAIWRVGQKLWLKDMPGFYAEVRSFPWSAATAPVVNQLIEFQRESNIRLIGIAYSSIQPLDVAKLLGVSVEEAETLVLSRGWTKSEGMIIPEEPPVETIKITSAEDQLGKLTDFVTFLEN